MKVKLIQYTPEPEKVIAAAAKLCYSRVGVDEIMEDLSGEKTEKFLDMLMSLGHESPIEHISFTFAVEGVSRVLTHQLVRHRIASYSQQSQRYVKLDQFEYIIPPSIEVIPEAKDMFLKAMNEDQEKYNALVNILQKKHYDRLIKEGKSEKQAKRISEKMAIEDSRYVFPNACETKIVFTMNARTLLNFFNHRCCQRAQWEIRDMATKMLKIVKEVAPVIFKNAGPKCLVGPCPEGDMTCGKMREIREAFLQPITHKI
ncbi:FAD-dependent thymidylate synthase [Crassaminicella thermophila]|uniref:Flavin-dependent thymidylate synthase n=1 Tax=Crassaminicella thermophila TaxID=2599308 RepID=A0A5C0SCA3_CRATE|nr:FAD-dependent thymidylate synthase [Crassaminicella thermophila]QEK11148.1 FAD-dependent thymidylate synthase [Crassaminicella thermophila]